jgi:hypothetical protein
MQFVFADGSVRLYEPVSGVLLEGKECLVFFLGGLPSGEIDPTDPAIVSLREHSSRRDAVIAKVELPKFSAQILEFEVPGEIRVVPRRNAPPPLPDPQLPFRLRYPPQEVSGDFDNDGDVDGRDFVVWMKVGRDTTARGLVAIGPTESEPPFIFEGLFGTFVPGTETGPNYIVLLVALAHAPLRFENLAVATVHPDPALPGCDIWDFQSNGIHRRGAPLRLSFDAAGKTRFFDGAAEDDSP